MYCERMKEEFLYYIWQQKLFMTLPQITTDGLPVEVIDVGRRNVLSGPDFFNAKLRIGNTVWAGNVEMHCKSSDWYKHGHQEDAAYDNVILHVVMVNDMSISRRDGQKLTQMVLQWPAWLNENYHSLCCSKEQLPCMKRLHQIPSIFFADWLNGLVVERLQQKHTFITQQLEQNVHNWEETFYWVIARNFGFHTNSLPFEWTARSLPLMCIAKHKNNLLQIEAMLFGQAGLLPTEPEDEYSARLLQEYQFLQNKFQLTPIKEGVWKMGGVRPGNSPYIRLAQLASLLHNSSKLFSKILETEHLHELYRLFEVQPSDYWQTHTRFAQANKMTRKTLGKSSITILVINTVIPMLFAYGKQQNNEHLCERALDFLQQLPSEQNTIIQQWEQAGIHSKNAFESQALLQLWHCYCDEKKCLRCRIGHKILTCSPRTEKKNEKME